jgi:hypothetical protein
MDGRGEEKLACTAEELATRESSGGAVAQKSCGGARNGCGGVRDGCGGARDSEEARLRWRKTARRRSCGGGEGTAVLEKLARRWLGFGFSGLKRKRRRMYG